METNKAKLGFGMMRLPKQPDGGQIDIEQTKQMVDRFLEAGFDYFDTAFIYDQGKSEEAIKKVLTDRYPRDAFRLATKLNAWLGCHDEASAKQEFEISLERTGAGYFDYYLLHGINNTNYEKYLEYGIWDFVKEQKEKGLIRHMGFSFHGTPELLEQILNEHPEAEFVQLQINYADWDSMSVKAKECYEIVRNHQLPVIVMEPVKGGLLAAPPQKVADVLKEADPNASPASWAIRYVASMEGVEIVLSGMSNLEQVEDNVSYMKDFQPFSEEENKVMERAGAALKEYQLVPCTGCRYCVSGCPMNICIPEIFEIMNLYNTYQDLSSAVHHYGMKTTGSGKASDCLSCGQCEGACPQHLEIISFLEKAKELFE